MDHDFLMFCGEFVKKVEEKNGGKERDMTSYKGGSGSEIFSLLSPIYIQISNKYTTHPSCYMCAVKRPKSNLFHITAPNLTF